MSKTLVIVESPAKSKNIQKYLGNDYIVKASIGHIRDLPKKELGIDIENDFEPTYVVSDDKIDVVKGLKNTAKTVDAIYLAADPDREGEAIAWHLHHLLKSSCSNIHRIEFHEITKNAVNEAVKNPHDIDLDMVNSQQARRILDRIVGYKLSPWISNALGKERLSAGRVQSVTLRIVCDRENEIRNFKPEEYWKIYAVLKSNKEPIEFSSELIKFEENKIEIKNKVEADTILNNLNNATYIVDNVEKKDKLKKPAPPFTTSKLQQEGNIKLRWDSTKTMKVAQQLYEGIELENGQPQGLITYMRTDSTRIAEDFQNETLSFIKTTFGKEYVPEKPNIYKSKADAQDAHEAVRPTAYDRTPDSIKQYLNEDQYLLYKLIWERYIASQMASAIMDTLTVLIKANKYTFRASGSAVKFQGFMVLYQESEEDKPENKNELKSDDKILLPNMELGEKLDFIKLNPERKFTKPPSRFTEASLIKELEKQGVGRPSTYASIMSTLKFRTYIYVDNNKIIPSKLGEEVVDILVQYFPDLMEIKFTAKMEDDLDFIAKGENRWVDVLDEFYSSFKNELDKALQEVKPREKEKEYYHRLCPTCGEKMIVIRHPKGTFVSCEKYPECNTRLPYIDSKKITDFKCDLCGNNLYYHEMIKDKKKIKFLACTNYPTCKNTVAIDTKGNPIPKPVLSEELCPKCGEQMFLRTGKNGKFYSCSKYPDCDGLKPYIDENTKTIPCNKCGSPMLFRNGKNGYFYGCSNYPDCKNIVGAEKNGKPKEQPKETEEKCPKCGTNMLLREGKKGKFYSCPNYPECDGVKQYIDANTKTISCEKCNGIMTLRAGKNGYFYGCTNYPECKNIISANKEGDIVQKNDLPETEEKCPKCGTNMILREGKNGKFYSCPKYPQCDGTKPYIGKDSKTIPCNNCGKPMILRKGRDGYFYGCSGYPNCKTTVPATKSGKIKKD